MDIISAIALSFVAASMVTLVGIAGCWAVESYRDTLTANRKQSSSQRSNPKRISRRQFLTGNW